MQRTEAPRYEEDFYSWTQDQANKLRQMQDDAKEGRSTVLDLPNLIEEVESLGRQERNALGSLLRQVMIHLCVGAYATEQDLATNKRHWAHEIETFRGEVVELLNDNPGLKRHLDELCFRSWEAAQRAASRRLGEMSSMTQSEEQTMLNTLLGLNCPDSNDVVGFDWHQFHKHATKKTIMHYLQVDPRAPRYPPFATDAFTNNTHADDT